MSTDTLSFKRIIIQIILAIFLLPGILNSTEVSGAVQNLLLFVFGILIIGITLIEYKGNFKIYFSKIDILYISFLIFAYISSFINRDLQHFFAISKLLFIYIVLVTCQRNIPHLLNIKVFLKSYLLISFIVLLIGSVQSIPINVANYSGIFSNGNNFGVFVASIFLIIFSLVLKNIYFKEKKQIIVNLFLSLLLLYYVFISSSRTAIYGIVMVMFTVLISMLFLKTNNKILRSIYIVIILTVFIISISIIINPINYQDFLSALNRLFGQDADAQTSRIPIWENIIDNSKFFGTESEYMLQVTGHTSHNSFLEQIGRYGWISGVFYMLFWVASLIKSFSYFKDNYIVKPYSILIFSSILLFILMSMVEMLTHSSIMYVALFTIGSLLNYTDQNNFYNIEDELND